MEVIIKSSKESYIIGSNFGPFESKIFKETYTIIFQHFTHISFRERKSCSFFPDLTNVDYAPDPVLGLNINSIIKRESDKDYYIISNINVERRKGLEKCTFEYELRLAQIADQLVLREKEVVFMSFCTFEEDEISINRIIKMMKWYNKNNVKIHIHREIDESLKFIAGSKGIIATRFHAMILSFALNIPVFPIIYSDKMLNVIRDYQFRGVYCSLQDLANTNVEFIIKALSIKPNIPREIIELSKEALKYEY
jgi:colanic acid/amylovoran biosynthesis protein